MLEITGLSLSYGHVHALRDISLRVAEGEIVTLIGANGAGKSSTLKAVSGLHPVEGSITFMKKRIDAIAPHSIVARGIAHCPEGRRVFYDLSVRENLLMGGYLLARDELAETMDSVIGIFPRLGERISQAGGTLSGGEQQMLAIARALMSRPSLLMLDEPSLGLAPIMVEKIFESIAELNGKGLTVLLVEQNAHLALQMSHRAYVLEQGRITIHGPSSEVAGDSDVMKAYLGC